MTAVLVFCLLLGSVRALVDLSCSDNATCIEQLGKDLVQSLRERKAVRLFDTLTIEPLSSRQGRSLGGVWGMMEDHALSFDWGDYTFRISVPKDGRDDALDLELYESRAVKEEPDPSPKKSSSKVEDEKGDEPATPKRGIRRRRRQKKKVMQALIPLMFGMKSAGVVIFAFALVTVLTLKAFMASKLALVVTIGMALKRLYDSYGITGVGFQNHPYLYSQYPIDFPSASSHAYSVSGVSPQFASNEMYSPNMLGANAQEFMQQQDASAQQSQQAPLLVNSTHAAERWDGKSIIRKLFEPILDSVKTVINPIANIFYGAIPTFRGLNTEAEVSTESIETNTVEEVKRPREFLLPQPRFFAQRKNFVKTRTTPKKHTELGIDLDKLKQNKDLIDYIKTKKYKHNYPNTYFYPRVKYVINPNVYYNKPNNSRLLPYRRFSSPAPRLPLPSPPTTKKTTPLTYITPTTTTISILPTESEWKPIAVVTTNTTSNNTINTTSINHNPFNITNRKTKRIIKRFILKRPVKPKKRTKRDLSLTRNKLPKDSQKSFISSVMHFFRKWFYPKPENETKIVDKMDIETKTKVSSVAKEHPPLYYSIIYDALVISLDIVEGFYNVHEYIINYYLSDDLFYKTSKPIKKKRKNKNKSKPLHTKLVELEVDESKVEIIDEKNKVSDELVNKPNSGATDKSNENKDVKEKLNYESVNVSALEGTQSLNDRIGNKTDELIKFSEDKKVRDETQDNLTTVTDSTKNNHLTSIEKESMKDLSVTDNSNEIVTADVTK